MQHSFKAVTGKMNKLECYKRYVIHQSLRSSDVYFGQPPILDYLSEHGASTQKELSNATGVSPASVAVSVKRMQKSGLLTKVADENDQRCNRIALTDRGEQQVEIMHNCFDKVDSCMFGGFSNEELALYEAFLDRLIQNLSSELPKGKDFVELLKAQMKSHQKGGDSKNG